MISCLHNDYLKLCRLFSIDVFIILDRELLGKKLNSFIERIVINYSVSFRVLFTMKTISLLHTAYGITAV